MPLTIQNPEAERLAKDVAKQTGEPLESTAITALQERLEQIAGVYPHSEVEDVLEAMLYKNTPESQ
jgi:hypothetical protein